MDAVVRAAAIYLFLLVVFRLSGKRTLAQITTLEFILLLVIGEATQQALLGDDFSMTNAFIVILTFIAIDIAISKIKDRSARAERLIEGTPLILVDEGRLLSERMHRERVDEADIMSAARHLHGLERLDQIKYAVLERSGGITIIPQPTAKKG
jgi:uncharacterized membrane protein YcaP (DUF421 family)